MNTKDDKFILGGHEFTSRFILGSGKFSLDLVKACLCAVQTKAVWPIFWIIFRMMSHCFRILPGQEMQRKRSASQDCQENSDAAIS